MGGYKKVEKDKRRNPLLDGVECKRKNIPMPLWVEKEAERLGINPTEYILLALEEKRNNESTNDTNRSNSRNSN